MESKEIVLNEIKRLEHNLKIYEKENMTAQIEYAKTNIKVNELILKDLEELEELKKIMGTPIQDIMKKLRKLETIENHFIYDDKETRFNLIKPITIEDDDILKEV